MYAWGSAQSLAPGRARCIVTVFSSDAAVVTQSHTCCSFSACNFCLCYILLSLFAVSRSLFLAPSPVFPFVRALLPMLCWKCSVVFETVRTLYIYVTTIVSMVLYNLP